MSRSYKKHPRVKDSASKNMKRFANKKVRRRSKELPKKGKSYKKVFQSYDISDWNWFWTREQAIKDWESAQDASGYSWIKENFDTLEKYLIYWEKCVKRK